jgi:hypothetical protein
MRRTWLIAIGLGVAACARERPPTEPQTLGMTCQSTSVAGDRHRAPIAPPYEAQRLVEVIAQLAISTGNLDHALVVSTFRLLADTLAIVAPMQVLDIEEVRHAAEELRAAKWTPRTRADLTRMGLVSALHALFSTQPFYGYDDERYRHAITVLATALASIDPNASLNGQAERVMVALRDVVGAVYVAVGARSPFDAVAVGAR